MNALKIMNAKRIIISGDLMKAELMPELSVSDLSYMKDNEYPYEIVLHIGNGYTIQRFHRDSTDEHWNSYIKEFKEAFREWIQERD